MNADTVTAADIACDVMRLASYQFGEVFEPLTAETPDGGLLKVTAEFSGDRKGRLEWLLTDALASVAAENMVGCDPDEVTDAYRADAAAELGNVLCGRLLTGLLGAHMVFDIRRPVAQPIMPEVWESFAGDAATIAVLLDDEHPILFRFEVEGERP
jgi:chemotaxis protein CheY-P-specific phosphatase CheC